MATLLDTPKPAPKYDDIVEKRFKEARKRIRTLDFFSAGLWLFLGAMVYLLIVLLIDRYVEVPKGSGWAAFAGGIILAGGFLYWSLFRPSRREINPYFVAKQVEGTIANAKNSVVNWVDLHDDEGIDVAIRHAVSTKAGKDLKTIDVDRAIERKQVVWLAGFGAFAFVVASIVYFLPPLRTKIELVQPNPGDTTIFSTQDFRVAVKLKGRIPDVGHPEAARMRIWYNADDTETFEERPLEPSQDDPTKWDGFVGARQTRTGFTYQILAGKAFTPKYTLTVRILPVIESYEVRYEYPEYLNKPAATVNDLNLIGYYGTKVTMTVRTNRDLQAGKLEINNGEAIVPGVVMESDKQALLFTFPLENQGRYRIWFTTVEGEKNTESPNPKMTLLDPTPMFTHFELRYTYPAYLRWKNQTLPDLKRPEIDAIRGTRVTLLAHANRPIREAGLRFPEVSKILDGQGVAGQPQSIRFDLPPLDRDGEAQVWFSPTTNEKRIEPITIKIKVKPDNKPEVKITSPEPPQVEIPANGTLAVDGFATDDYGVKSMTLKLKQIAPKEVELTAKLFREGKGFLREKDKSYPTRVEYKDSQKLGELKTLDGKPFPLRGDEILEYWLEAEDNCDVPGAPHKGESEHKLVKVLPPKNDPMNQQKQDQQDKNRQQEENKNNQQQDQKNENENRDPNQPPPQGGEKNNPDKKNDQPEKKGDQPEKKGDQPEKKGDQPEKKGDQPEQKGDQPEKKNGEGNNNDDKTEKEAQDLQNKLDQNKGKNKPGPQEQPEQKPENPADAKNEGQGEKGGQQGANKQPPKADPMNNPEGGQPGDNKQQGKMENAPKAENKPNEKQDLGKNDPGEAKPDQQQQLGGGGGERAKDKPQGEPDPMGKDGANGQKEKDPGQGKGNGDQKRPDADPMRKENENKVSSGNNKPDKEPGRGEQKPAASEPDQKQPPQDVASNKNEKSEKPGETKPAPNPMNAQGAGEEKPNLAKKDPNDPKQKNEGAAKPEGKQDPNAKKDDIAKANDKPEQKQGDPNGGNEGDKKDPPKIDPKDLRDLAKELRDPMKREEALKKMQDLAGDKKSREDAAKKLDEMMKNATDQEKKELADAMKDLKDAVKGNDNGGNEKPGPDQGNKTEAANNKPAPKKENPKEGKNGNEGANKPGPKEDQPKELAQDKPNPNGKDGKPDPKKVDPKNPEAKKIDGKDGDPKQDLAKGKEGNPKKEPGKGKDGDAPKELAKGENGKDPGKKDVPPPEAEVKPNQPGQDPTEKVMGGNRDSDPVNPTAEMPPMLADKKNQLKSGQMQLEKFKQNEKLLREEKKWTEDEWKDFIKNYQNMLNKKQTEVADLEKQWQRSGGSSALNSSERIKMDPRNVGEALGGSKFTPPPGFGDSYKQFTEDLSGKKK